jgi:hypothetical protein
VLVVVGRVGRAHGLRGEVAVEVRTDEPETRLAPGAVICPFATLGVGAVHLVPKADNPVQMTQNLMGLNGGGGLEITFKKQITLRLDARNWTIFDENVASNAQEYTGGLAIFF